MFSTSSFKKGHYLRPIRDHQYKLGKVTTSDVQWFGVRCVHTLAWDVGILVSSRNWNIPRITWSIIPIVQESKGHAKKYYLGQSKTGKKRWPLRPCRLLPCRSVVRWKKQKHGFHSPVSRLPGWHPQCWNNNFILLHLRLNDCLICTRRKH